MPTDYRIELAAVDPWDQGAPRFNGPAVIGAGRGAPVRHLVPTVGTRPMAFAGDGLPAGLTIDRKTGVIAGSTDAEGDHRVAVAATNEHGRTERVLRVKIGGGLALTPPMGWNSWNCWGSAVTQARVQAAADAMVASGLAARGYAYVNIDSSWQGERCGPLDAIQGNHKFPDMKRLVNGIHGLGLKAGIYSTPWVTAWGGENLIGESVGASTGVEHANSSWARQGRYVGATKYEPNDARQWAEWGLDYLKYDWDPCDPDSARRMRDALDATGRDFVFSITTHASLQHASTWTELVHLWRDNPDTRDAWESVVQNGFLTTGPWEPHTGPGHWFDADMLVIGRLGWGDARDNNLTVDEQMTHMTLWALLASPLLLGCDLEALDDLTLRLAGNEEVIAVNQDELGRQGYCARETRRGDGQGGSASHERVYAKPLADGSTAVGLFNLGPEPADIAVDLADVGLEAECRRRNAWQQTDVDRVKGSFRCRVPSHGARLYVLTP